jgi:O-antigen ligase
MNALSLLVLVLASVSAIRLAKRLESVVVLTLFAFLVPAFNSAILIPFSENLRWIALGITTLLAAVRALVLRAHPAHRTVDLTVIWFVALALASVSWSIAPSRSAGPAIAFLVMVLLSIALDKGGFGAINLIRCFCALAVIVAAGGVTALVMRLVTSTGRFAGLFDNPNLLGVLNALLFPAVLSAALGSSSFRQRVFYGGTASVLVLSSFLAASRSGIIAMSLAYLYLVRPKHWSRQHTRRVIAAVLPFIIAVGVSVATTSTHRFSTEDSRTQLWRAFPTLFEEEPLFGHGFATTELALAPFTLEQSEVNFHNSYLNLLNDLGLLGGVAYLAILWRVWRLRNLTDPGLVAVVIGGLFSALFESWMLAIGSGAAVLFWLAVLQIMRSTNGGFALLNKPIQARDAGS